MQAIHHVVDVCAPPDRVFRALSRVEGLSGWWTTRVRTDATDGNVIAFTFGDDFNPEMRVTALTEATEVDWEMAGGHEPWDGSTFRFTLEPTGEGTRVRFWQYYGRELSDDAYGSYNYNWGYYLDSLRLLCETGTGRPHTAEA
jgi:uncharacterized protein YndB with AHSA1/START domain